MHTLMKDLNSTRGESDNTRRKRRIEERRMVSMPRVYIETEEEKGGKKSWKNSMAPTCFVTGYLLGTLAGVHTILHTPDVELFSCVQIPSDKNP